MIAASLPFASPLEAARALAPRIRALAEQIDRDRELPPDLVRAIADAGLFRMGMPAAWGGYGADALTVLRTVEEVARADGSTGWCVAMGVNTFRQSAEFRDDVRGAIFYSDPVGVGAGSTAVRGRAVAVQGGYRVTGRWFFASGCMHASSLLGGCHVYDGDTRRMRSSDMAEELIVYVWPKSAGQIVDTWRTSGMRGTGSHDIVVTDVFVPEEHTFPKQEQRARVSGLVNKLPSFDLSGCNFACVGLGVARAAIDELIELAAVKTPRASTDLLRARPLAQAHVAEAEATLRSARAFLFEAVDDMQRSVAAGEGVTPGQRAVVRLAMTHAAASASRAVNLVRVAAGTTPIFTTSPLERLVRDAQVVETHVQLQAVNYEIVGRSLFGLESHHPLF